MVFQHSLSSAVWIEDCRSLPFVVLFSRGYLSRQLTSQLRPREFLNIWGRPTPMTRPNTTTWQQVTQSKQNSSEYYDARSHKISLVRVYSHECKLCHDMNTMRNLILSIIILYLQSFSLSFRLMVYAAQLLQNHSGWVISIIFFACMLEVTLSYLDSLLLPNVVDVAINPPEDVISCMWLSWFLNRLDEAHAQLAMHK